MINKFMVVTSAATLVLTIGGSLIFTANGYTGFNQAETRNDLKTTTTTTADLVQKQSVPSKGQTAFEVQNSIISLAIPQSITVIFFLVMAGLGGFLKLKIAHAKFKHSK